MGLLFYCFGMVFGMCIVSMRYSHTNNHCSAYVRYNSLAFLCSHLVKHRAVTGTSNLHTTDMRSINSKIDLVLLMTEAALVMTEFYLELGVYRAPDKHVLMKVFQQALQHSNDLR